MSASSEYFHDENVPLTSDSAAGHSKDREGPTSGLFATDVNRRMSFTDDFADYDVPHFQTNPNFPLGALTNGVSAREGGSSISSAEWELGKQLFHNVFDEPPQSNPEPMEELEDPLSQPLPTEGDIIPSSHKLPCILRMQSPPTQSSPSLSTAYTLPSGGLGADFSQQSEDTDTDEVCAIAPLCTTSSVGSSSGSLTGAFGQLSMQTTRALRRSRRSGDTAQAEEHADSTVPAYFLPGYAGPLSARSRNRLQSRDLETRARANSAPTGKEEGGTRNKGKGRARTVPQDHALPHAGGSTSTGPEESIRSSRTKGKLADTRAVRKYTQKAYNRNAKRSEDQGWPPEGWDVKWAPDERPWFWGTYCIPDEIPLGDVWDHLRKMFKLSNNCGCSWGGCESNTRTMLRRHVESVHLGLKARCLLCNKESRGDMRNRQDRASHEVSCPRNVARAQLQQTPQEEEEEGEEETSKLEEQDDTT